MKTNCFQFIAAEAVAHALRGLCKRIGQRDDQIKALLEKRARWETDTDISVGLYNNLIDRLAQDQARRREARAILDALATDLEIDADTLARLADEAGAAKLAAELRKEKKGER
jgi:predicted lactoylglutathione lyase